MNYPLFFSLPPVRNKVGFLDIFKSLFFRQKNFDDDFLKSIKDYLGVKYFFPLSSGRASLWVALKAISKINPEKFEIIIPAYTCPAIVSAILKAGLKPILCDNNLNDFGFSFGDLIKKINKNTLAIILVHLFGYPVNISKIKEICKQEKIFLIEDAAQAFGNFTLENISKKLGVNGDISFFSFGRGKPVSLLYGGGLAINSEEILDEIKKIYQSLSNENTISRFKYKIFLTFYSIFSNPYLYWLPQRMPFLHLGETIFEPDFIVSKFSLNYIFEKVMERLEIEKEIRENNSEWYSKNFKDIPFILEPPISRFPYLRYPLLITKREIRDKILSELINNGTGASFFYPCPLNELKGLKDILNNREGFPNAKKLSESLITLPLHFNVNLSIRNKINFIIMKHLN